MRKALTIILSVLLVVSMFVSCNQDDIIDDLFEPTYSIKVAGTIGHGTVSADKTNAHEGDTVTLTATPAEGYELSAFSVTDDKANAITVTDGSFTMPADNVTVGATFSKTAETINQEAAAAVTTKIGAIGTVSYTAESKAKIDEARSAYDALTSEQKELVTNYSTLTTAESTYSTLKAAAEQQAADPETATYTVKHLQQNIADDNYTLKESETKTGTVGQPTAASAKSYDGFTAQTVTQVTVAASGTVVEIKYDRKSYTVTFNANGGSTVTSQSVRYGATATKPADPTKTATTTTEYTFADWYSDSGLTTSFSFDTAIKEDITLYAKWTETAVTPQKTAGSISYATASVSKTTGDAAFTNELTKTGDGTVSYASDNTAVATVNASTGEVTIKGAGTATITATVTDSASYTYATKTASYTLTVTVAVTSVIINNAPSEALFVNSTGTLTATVSPANATDKTIVWSSSDSDYVSINSETGEYTIMGTKGYGSATITATATNGTEDTSDDVTATCTITGKVTYTSLKAGDVLHTGDTFYTGSTVYFAGNTNVSFPTTAGVITIVEATKDGYNGKFYQFKRSSNGTWPNWSYRVKDNTDGVYITDGSGTSSGDRFTLAVHTKE